MRELARGGQAQQGWGVQRTQTAEGKVQRLNRKEYEMWRFIRQVGQEPHADNF